jgi:AcrR family transcriptional regulator
MPRLSKTRKELLTTIMKESIFEAATSVLNEHGVDGTTMNRVAETADLAKSSLYDYFRSKEELLEFVVDRMFIPFMQAVNEILQADLPAPQKLEKVLRIALETGAKHKGILRLLERVDREQDVKKRTRPQILAAFTTIFEQGVEEGSFHPYNPAYTGRMFMGAFSQLTELRESSASDKMVNEYAEVLIDATLHGVSIHVVKNRAAGKTSPRSANP